MVRLGYGQWGDWGMMVRLGYGQWGDWGDDGQTGVRSVG